MNKKKVYVLFTGKVNQYSWAKMIRKAYCVVLVLLLLGCSSNRVLVNPNQEASIVRASNELSGKRVELKLQNGAIRRVKDVRLTSDSLYFSNRRINESIAYSEVRSITLSPRLSWRQQLSIPVILFGIYNIGTIDRRGDTREELGKFYIGSLASFSGLAGFIFGGDERPTVYYLE